MGLGLGCCDLDPDINVGAMGKGRKRRERRWGRHGEPRARFEVERVGAAAAALVSLSAAKSAAWVVDDVGNLTLPGDDAEIEARKRAGPTLQTVIAACVLVARDCASVATRRGYWPTTRSEP